MTYRVTTPILILLAIATAAHSGQQRQGPLNPGEDYTVEVLLGHGLTLELYEDLVQVWLGDPDRWTLEMDPALPRTLNIRPRYAGAETTLTVLTAHERLVATLREVSREPGLASTALKYWQVEGPRGASALVLPGPAERRRAEGIRAQELARQLLPAATEREISRRLADRRASTDDFRIRTSREDRVREAALELGRAEVLGDRLYLEYLLTGTNLDAPQYFTFGTEDALVCPVLEAQVTRETSPEGKAVYRHHLTIDLTPVGKDPLTSYVLGSYLKDDNTPLYQIRLTYRG